MKKDKGVSLITLTITIVILIILAGISVYYGTTQSLDKATEARSFNEMIEVTEAIAQRTLMNKINASKYPFVGDKLSGSSNNIEIINNIEYSDGWYRIDEDDYQELNLDNITGSYIVNYSTGEVVSIKPILYADQTLYTSAEVMEVMGNSSTSIVSDMYDNTKGVNKPILLTGMIPVRYINNKWIVTSPDDEKWYDYSAENKSWANVMLYDEISVAGYSNEDLRKASLAELEGREVTTSGSLFVWIPRFTSNSAGNIVYSNLTSDYTQNGFTLSSAFTYGNTKLTGFWESKFDAEIR